LTQLVGLRHASKIIFNFRNGLQSPININKPYLPEEFALKINLKPPKGKMMLMNDGYKLIFTADSFGEITHGSHQFDAKQIEIHHPSEHSFGDDEVRSPIEAQIIFQDMFGNTAAVAILFKINKKESPFLRALGFGVENPLFALKLRNNEFVEFNKKDTSQLDLGPLVNNGPHYITYEGSLTSPPCTQNVKWFVLLKKLNMTQEQLDYFPILFGKESNIRGIQDRSNRPLSIT
jgi:carbonic anhydrase